jgi:hypothetical protein
MDILADHVHFARLMKCPTLEGGTRGHRELFVPIVLQGLKKESVESLGVLKNDFHKWQIREDTQENVARLNGKRIVARREKRVDEAGGRRIEVFVIRRLSGENTDVSGGRFDKVEVRLKWAVDEQQNINNWLRAVRFRIIQKEIFIKIQKDFVVGVQHRLEGGPVDCEALLERNFVDISVDRGRSHASLHSQRMATVIKRGRLFMDDDDTNV